MSVLFPPPGAVTAPAVPVLARDDAEAPAPAPAPAVTAEAAPPAAPAAAPALDREDLYQDFMRRLRRDVLEQREQIGELY
jgi:cytochrome c5